MPAVTANIHCLVTWLALTATPMYSPINAQHAANRLNKITLHGVSPVDNKTAKSPKNREGKFVTSQ